MINSEESTNQDQIDSERNMILNDYTSNIDSQTSKTRMDLNNENFIELFISNYLNYKDLSKLEDRDIYICPEFSDNDRDDLSLFETELENIFYKNFAIKFIDSDIYIYDIIYKTIFINISKTFTFFINGLQKIDESFEEDLPNWKELSYKYFLTNIYKAESKDKYDYIRSYINYIFEICDLNLDTLIEVSLLESKGNVDLSSIYIELANERIVCEDNEFFIKKIKDFIFSDIYEQIVESLVNTIL